MISVRRRFILAAALVLAATAGARAQSEQSKAEDNFVTQKMFQNRVFDIKNRDPLALSRVLSPLTSGFRGAVVSPNQEFRTISVRDFAENIAVIEEAIRRLDQPEASRPTVEFRVHLLVASNEEGAPGRYPAELSDVVRQLQTSLGYRSFGLMGSQVVRGREGNWEAYNKGVADLRLSGDAPTANKPVFYNYQIRSVTLDDAGGRPRIMVGEFVMGMNVPVSVSPDKTQYQEVGFKSPVSLRDGEKVTVGTISIADKSVVVILSASTSR